MTPGAARMPTSIEQTNCTNPTADWTDPTLHALGSALPCVFTSWSKETPGSGVVLVYLTPLNAHTQRVAQAVIDGSLVSKIPGIEFKFEEGMQSLAWADDQLNAVSEKYGAHLGAEVNLDGSVTVTIYDPTAVSEASVVSASHVPGYQAEPHVVHGNRLVFHSA